MHQMSRRFALRERTQEAHAKLDASVGPIETAADHRRYLAGIARFRLPLERTIESAGYPGEWTWRPTMIAPELEVDLSDLEVDVSDETVPRLTIETGSALLGILYVLEGSNLGAQLTARRAASLGFDAAHGARHLHRQCGGIANWRAFVGLLESATPFSAGQASAAAHQAFQLAQAGLSGGRHGRH